MINTNAVSYVSCSNSLQVFIMASCRLKKVTPSKIYYSWKIKKNTLSYVHPFSFTYNFVRLFLSPWEIPVDINNTHICTNRLTVRETLLINKKYILRFFSTNGDLC